MFIIFIYFYGKTSGARKNTHLLLKAQGVHRMYISKHLVCGARNSLVRTLEITHGYDKIVTFVFPVFVLWEHLWCVEKGSACAQSSGCSPIVANVLWCAKLVDA